MEKEEMIIIVMDAINRREDLDNSSSSSIYLHPHDPMLHPLSLMDIFWVIRNLNSAGTLKKTPGFSSFLNQSLEEIRENSKLDIPPKTYFAESFRVEKGEGFDGYYEENSDRLLFKKSFKKKAEHIVSRMLDYLDKNPSDKEEPVEETFKKTFPVLPDKAKMTILDQVGNVELRKEKILELIPEIVKEYQNDGKRPPNQGVFLARLLKKLPEEYKKKKSGTGVKDGTILMNMKDVFKESLGTDYTTYIKENIGIKVSYKKSSQIPSS